jgi:hypothetical protein
MSMVNVWLVAAKSDSGDHVPVGGLFETEAEAREQAAGMLERDPVVIRLKPAQLLRWAYVHYA